MIYKLEGYNKDRKSLVVKSNLLHSQFQLLFHDRKNAFIYLFDQVYNNKDKQSINFQLNQKLTWNISDIFSLYKKC